jgi:hypothetical protein
MAIAAKMKNFRFRMVIRKSGPARRFRAVAVPFMNSRSLALGREPSERAGRSHWSHAYLASCSGVCSTRPSSSKRARIVRSPIWRIADWRLLLLLGRRACDDRAHGKTHERAGRHSAAAGEA